MKPALTPNRLSRAVTAAACAFEIPPREVLGRCRFWPIARARLALYAALYRACETSYPELSRVLKRDQSTIIKGIQRVEAVERRDRDYAAAVARIAEAARA